jgi:hypothetical protein
MSEVEKDKLKKILITMNNSDKSLDIFYETLEKITGASIPFTTFKDYLDKYYSFIPKSKYNLILIINILSGQNSFIKIYK